ncbi:MAG: ribonuclease PH [Pseudomonadota bacterium]|nr:ribonuclease PH [Pseudomonadota bacterium]
MRRDHRKPNQSRTISFIPDFTRYAEGSVLSCCGYTKVICNTSVEEGVPRFLRDQQHGWLTAEYSMLPRATHTRGEREVSRGKQNGRSTEIQRLIGRSLRNCIDLSLLKDYTLMIDCDVIQADGGTRTTALNGAIISVIHAIQTLQYKQKIKHDPLKYLLTAFSFGVVDDTVILDLNYEEDSHIDVDCNIVLTEHGDIAEIQGTGEKKPLKQEHLSTMLEMAQQAQPILLKTMRKAINRS